ncbi:transketolase [Streptomyces tendae]|uniref:transketolase n=1 Tax=Streptomyces tendae TaxID=1932 RepID=UPI00367CE9D5
MNSPEVKVPRHGPLDSTAMERKAREIRKRTLHASLDRPHHLGGQLSCVEILVSIFYGHARTVPENRFVLSKGHACLTLYAVLVDLGILTEQDLRHAMTRDGRLLGHPCRTTTPGVDVSTGSLGMGLSIAVGLALGARLQGRETHVHVVLGDGELQSGQVWEAFMLMAQTGMDTVHPVIDCNGAQADGPTGEIVAIEPLAEKINALGLHAVECDGHDLEALARALTSKVPGRPTVVIAHTVKGRGVPWMEGDNTWHSGSFDTEQLSAALTSLS